MNKTLKQFKETLSSNEDERFEQVRKLFLETRDNIIKAGRNCFKKIWFYLHRKNQRRKQRIQEQ